jgi:hypothetical protein
MSINSMGAFLDVSTAADMKSRYRSTVACEVAFKSESLYLNRTWDEARNNQHLPVV